MTKIKIAILTQPLGHNYGGLLQAYALQTHLRKMDCEVETLDRRSPSVKQLLVKTYILNFIKLLLGRIKSIPTSRKHAYVLSALTTFRDCRITMTQPITSEQGIRDYCQNGDFDVFIVGSDQVWRPRYSPSILNFYLDFLSTTKSSARRVAYAASFGVDAWEYSKDLESKCSSLAKQFDFVSVREESALALCESKLGVASSWVVDPTLLLNPSDYDDLIGENTESLFRDCVLSYVLDPAENKRSIADSVAKMLRKSAFSIKPEATISQVPNHELDKCVYPSVESWLQAFRDASYIVTDSFHGTVFAILFNKPFITIGNSERGMARFESLLSQFDLQGRLVESIEAVTPELIHTDIDWDRVNGTREKLAEEGKAFIRVSVFGENENV